MVRACRINMNGQRSLYGCDNKYVFYYDETNNIRKLHVTDGSFNATPKAFVLGGICFSSSTPTLDAAKIRKLLYIQDNVPEIKLKHIGKGSFTSILNSRALQPFLQLLLAKKINIHFGVLDTLYWSIVDIIDSVCFELPEFTPFSQLIKNTMYNACHSDLEGLAALLNEYGYPNLQRHQASDFMLRIAKFVNNNTDKNDSFASSGTLSLLTRGATLSNLAFIENNYDSESKLIESFSPFFLRVLYTYPLSTHIFDDEEEIIEQLDKFEYQYQGKPVAYEFTYSNNCIEIQLSDIVCGLIGKYYAFLSESSMGELQSIRSHLNDRQSINLRLLTQLIDQSDAESNGFIHSTLPVQTMDKNQFFLHN